MARNTAPKLEDQDSLVLTFMRDFYSNCGNEIVSVDEVTTDQAKPLLGADEVTVLLNGRGDLTFPRTIWERIKSTGATDVMIAQGFDKVFRAITVKELPLSKEAT